MLKIYNTLTRKIEDFKPLNPPLVNMYACGPTVYDYQHIGHMRRYVGDDILIRTLEFNGFRVKQAMNITDVGHLTSDSDTGEDKMEKGARKFGMSVWKIAKKFEKQFFNSIDALNIQRPDILMHATDYIKEQIVFIEDLEKKGFTYKIDDGIYFDTSKVKNYNKLSHQNLEDLKTGARIEMVKGKKNPADFALWKFSPKDSKRAMEWESPFARPPATSSNQPRSNQAGVAGEAKYRTVHGEVGRGTGFPGWHIECSTMAIKGLDTETLDIHTGGIDHISIHHINEIAQSEAATGKQFVKYWVHHNFLHVDGNKMSKSLGNIWTVEDVVGKGFDPLALRYLYLQTHYRQEMNFTWDALEAAQIAYKRLIEEVAKLENPKIARPPATSSNQPRSNQAGVAGEAKYRTVPGEVGRGCAEYEEKFKDAINDDLNMSKALSIVWELLKSDYPDSAIAESLFKMDRVLGLDLEKAREKKKQIKIVVPSEVQRLIEKRAKLRKQGSYIQADHIRNKIKKLGYNIKDTKKGAQIEKI